MPSYARTRAFSTILTLSIASSPAFSGDTAASDWSGFYGGLTAGYGWGESRQDNTLGPTTGDYDIEGGLYGFVVGHSWQFDRTLFGIEADWTETDIDGTTFNTCVSNCFTEVDWLATFRARLGYDFGDFVPFVTGGVGVSRLDVGTRTPLVPGQPLGDDDTNVGWVYGAGVDFRITGNWSGRVEYLNADLGETTYHIPSQSAAGKVDGDVDIFRAALIYQFGAGDGVASAHGTGHSSRASPGWDGFYLGGIYGDVDATSRQDNSFPATTGDYGIDGSHYGLVAGYNWSHSRLVYGIEGDISTADVDGQTNNVCGNLGCFTEINWLATIRARLGVDLGRFLPYATAGVAIGEVEVGTRVPINPGERLNDDDVNTGFVWGAGVDFKATDRIALKFEYLRADLGDSIYFIPSQGQKGTVPVDEMDIFRGAVTYRF